MEIILKAIVARTVHHCKMEVCWMLPSRSIF